MRVGGYVRLSRDEDKESYSSIQSQKSIIKECSLQNQWTVYRYYEDDNCSGYTFDRPGFNALLEDLEKDKIDIVMAKDLSRIGRHNAYTLLFVDRVKKLGKRLVLPMEGGGYDTCKDESDLLGIKTWYNEMYVKDISRKIKSSIKSRQKEGRMIIKEYFGYIRSSKDKHVLEIDMEAAETVKLIYNLYLSGLGYRKIAEILNEQGYLTPARHAKHRHHQLDIAFIGDGGSVWTPSAVQRILKNDIYIGTLRLGKTEKASIKGKSTNRPMGQQFVFEEQHPSIISKEQFTEVERMLNNRKRTGCKGAASKDNIFSGLLFCKDCGAYLIAYNKTGKPRSYICSSYHKYGKGSCQRHSIRESILEAIVKEYLKTTAEALKEELRHVVLNETESDFQDEQLLLSLKQEYFVLKERYKMLIIQKITDLRKENIDQVKNIIQQSFDELEKELHKRILFLEKRIDELEKHKEYKSKQGCTDALQLLYRIIEKPKLNKKDVLILIERIDLDKDGNPTVFLKGDTTPICKHIPEDVNLVPDL